MLDAKKAFDSVNHDYIEDTLVAYGFGEGFIRTFRTLYKDLTARILVNGFLSEAIRIERGVKQGDSLSCAIFIICIDPLLRNLNNSNKVKNIRYCKRTSDKNKITNFKAAAYADDISVICSSDAGSIQEVFSQYDKLTNRSGLELNADKTEILRLNNSIIKEYSFTYNSQLVNIKSVKSIKICGLHYCGDVNQEYELNVLDKIKKLSNKISKWIPRHLTMEGKSLIIKTFGLSQLIYNMQSYGFSEHDLSNVEKIIFKFIWSTKETQNGVDRIKRAVMKNDYDKGGMKITDVECLNRSLKLRQFIRAHNSKHAISTIQDILTSKDGCIKQEYSSISNEEDIVKSAQETLNIIIDHNREKYRSLEQEEYETDKNLIDEVASINLKEFLTRKKKVFALCILKQITDNGITNLGELVLAYEHEIDVNLNKAMKIVISSFPKHLINIAKCFNEEINNVNEKVKYLQLSHQNRKAIEIITTKEFQSSLKTACNRLEPADFNHRLGTTNFKPEYIINFRKMCQNSKLRNIFFRLIHNDFFTHERMLRYKMTNSDKCPRCGEVESTKHLLWDCSHVKHIWSLFNILLTSIGCLKDTVNNYENVYAPAAMSGINLIKIRIIQELIQIDRPKNWDLLKIKKIAINLICIEKYNTIKTNTKHKFEPKWGFLSAFLKQ